MEGNFSMHLRILCSPNATILCLDYSFVAEMSLGTPHTMHSTEMTNHQSFCWENGLQMRAAVVCPYQADIKYDRYYMGRNALFFLAFFRRCWKPIFRETARVLLPPKSDIWVWAATAVLSASRNTSVTGLRSFLGWTLSLQIS